MNLATLAAALLVAPAGSDARAETSMSPTATIAQSQAQVQGLDAVVPVRCDDRGAMPCVGTLVLHARLGGATVLVGRRSFSIDPALTSGVRVRLTADARRTVVRDAGRLVVTAQAKTRRASGTPVMKSEQLVLLASDALIVESFPALTWVEMTGTPSLKFSHCNGASLTADYSATGRTANHFPGTFSEAGTWTRTAEEDEIGVGTLRTSFTITSGTTVVTGTRTIEARVNCGDPLTGGLGGYGSYTAKVKVTEGSGPTAKHTTYSDDGLSYVYLTDVGRTVETHSGFMSNNDGTILDEMQR
jgi:hypothetical protein